MNRAERIHAHLTALFLPVMLEITDDSAKHAGHAGARAEGETHYHLRIVAEAFRGLSRVAAHQRVYAALAEEFAGGLHALSIDAKAP